MTRNCKYSLDLLRRYRQLTFTSLRLTFLANIFPIRLQKKLGYANKLQITSTKSYQVSSFVFHMKFHAQCLWAWKRNNSMFSHYSPGIGGVPSSGEGGVGSSPGTGGLISPVSCGASPFALSGSIRVATFLSPSFMYLTRN